MENILQRFLITCSRGKLSNSIGGKYIGEVFDHLFKLVCLYCSIARALDCKSESRGFSVLAGHDNKHCILLRYGLLPIFDDK